MPASPSASAQAAVAAVEDGFFGEPLASHYELPHGAFHAGRSKDYPLPRVAQPIEGLQNPSDNTVTIAGRGTYGRTPHYLDEADNEVGGFYAEDKSFVKWPPASNGAEATPGAKRRSKKDKDNKDKDDAPGSTRRQQNGLIGGVFSGNKIRHLKKEDGIPLWRSDIQFDFLKAVYEDTQPVFTRYPDGANGYDFNDIYVDAMCRSSKTSKILKDKLEADKEATRSMCMICLLVNLGRMNTTLNFFPEMRAQLRTYHSIPSLQAAEDPNAYKQLQDAPRLKSILKGASEDTPQPATLEAIREAPIPRTNPVNLIFVLCQYAPKVSEMHFPAGQDFFDLVMTSKFSSASRARAFLWLMWYYLESDFSAEQAERNPFGPGVVGEATGGLPVQTPPLEPLTDEEAALENQDTEEEKAFGEAKRLERKRILEMPEPDPRPTKRARKSGVALEEFDEDMENSMMNGDETPPVRRGRERPSARQSLLASGAESLKPSTRRRLMDDEESDLATPTGRRGKRVKRETSTTRGPRITLKMRLDPNQESASPVPPGNGHPILNQYADSDGNGTPRAPGSRRPRPPTQHQIALEKYRRSKIDRLLAEQKAVVYAQMRAKREAEDPIMRAARRIAALPDDYDSESENSWGKGGLVPNLGEEEDYGEEANFWMRVLQRAMRRTQRWEDLRETGHTTAEIAAAEAAKKAAEDEAAGITRGVNGDITANPAILNGTHLSNYSTLPALSDLEAGDILTSLSTGGAAPARRGGRGSRGGRVRRTAGTTRRAPGTSASARSRRAKAELETLPALELPRAPRSGRGRGGGPGSRGGKIRNKAAREAFLRAQAEKERESLAAPSSSVAPSTVGEDEEDEGTVLESDAGAPADADVDVAADEPLDQFQRDMLGEQSDDSSDVSDDEEDAGEDNEDGDDDVEGDDVDVDDDEDDDETDEEDADVTANLDSVLGEREGVDVDGDVEMEDEESELEEAYDSDESGFRSS